MDRTAAFVGAGLTVLAWVIFWKGLIEVAAHTHPDSATAHAFLNILDGTGSTPREVQ